MMGTIHYRRIASPVGALIIAASDAGLHAIEFPSNRHPQHREGWREGDHPLLDGIEPGSDFYFVHSYRVVCADETQSLATTPYAGGFTSVVGLGTTVGVQFHPEKSQHVGRRLLRNFLAL